MFPGGINVFLPDYLLIHKLVQLVMLNSWSLTHYHGFDKLNQEIYTLRTSQIKYAFTNKQTNEHTNWINTLEQSTIKMNTLNQEIRGVE